MRLLLTIILLIVSLPALSQQAQTPMEQAITSKLSEEINQNIQYRANEKQELDDLRKKLSEKK